MLADVFHNDNAFTAKSWGQVTRFTAAQCATMQREFLEWIKFDLFVSENEYGDWLGLLQQYLSEPGCNQPPPVQLPTPHQQQIFASPMPEQPQFIDYYATTPTSSMYGSYGTGMGMQSRDGCWGALTA